MEHVENQADEIATAVDEVLDEKLKIRRTISQRL